MNTIVRAGVVSAMTAAVAGIAITLLAGDSAEPKRVAIRVDCTKPQLCAVAEARALDVWSEHAGPGLPIDLVVDSDTLDGLAMLGAEWTVLDPDIDATAAVEASRLQFRALAQDWFAERQLMLNVEQRAKASAAS
jgi:hypothetical protein